MEDEDEFVDNNFCQNEFNKKILEDPDEFADIQIKFVLNERFCNFMCICIIMGRNFEKHLKIGMDYFLRKKIKKIKKQNIL